MNSILKERIGIICAAVLLGGCATPQPVLDLANRGAGAAILAEAELQRYLAAVQDSLSARLLVLRQLSAAGLEEDFSDKFSKFLQGKTGQSTGDEMLSTMRAVGEERRRLRDQHSASLAKLDETHKKALGDAVRAPVDAFATSRKAFMGLAQELTPEEWVALTALYARKIHDTIKEIQEDESKARVKAAEDEAANGKK